LNKVHLSDDLPMEPRRNSHRHSRYLSRQFIDLSWMFMYGVQERRCY
jgi:hypothetical protein